MKYEVNVSGQPFLVEVGRGQSARINGRPVQAALEQIGDLPVYSLAAGDGVYLVLIEGEEGDYRVEVDGRVYTAQVQRSRPQPHVQESVCREGGDLCVVVAAPLAGTLLSQPVVEGEAVRPAQVVAVLESMKMQMEIRAPHGGVIETVHQSPGSDVGQGEALVSIRRT